MNNLEKWCVLIGSLVIRVILIFALSVINGSILWLIYPHIHSLFPTAADYGIISKNLSWWNSVCISWLFSILLKKDRIEVGKK